MEATWPLTHNRRPWTEVQDDVLREAYGKAPVERIAKVLGRTVSATVVHARKLGLTKGCRVWTAEEIDRLAEFRSHMTMREASGLMGRSEWACQRKVLDMRKAGDERFKRIRKRRGE
ncbi:Uncharacterised protein [Collinsella intestinalis]|uniref:Uncharacterized protein n=1 Tax=Collinsella intestinalis TaxID=147207 RepID=A0A5K1IT52_9ACTN|nr:hypothetical protein [Collinsella intestinalis]VWL91592.1 Uncharacterised protein [Collinsella intestinalis]